MTYKEWKEAGRIKGSLYYMKHNLEKGNFKVYKRSIEKFKES
jgi:hypothetical protein